MTQTQTVESNTHHALTIILGAIGMGLVGVLCGGLFGEWRLGFIIGAAMCLGRLTSFRRWRRKT